MSLKNKILLVLIASLSCMFLACEDESIVLAPEALGLEYYPVEEGRYWIYEVDSTIVIGGGATLDSSHSFVKEEITSSFLNPEGDTSFVLTVSNSKSLTGNYTITDIWKIEKSATRVIRYEENRPFVKLIFPIKEGLSAENILFDEQLELNIGQQSMMPYLNWKYEVLQKGGSMNVANKNYANIIRVQQANNQVDFPNLVDQRFVEEVYAPEVGMIERKMEIFHTQCLPCPDQSWLEKADSGYQVTKRLIESN